MTLAHTMRAKTILVVDDDNAVLALSKWMLESEGYRVYAAGSADQAIAIAQQLQCELNLLITDMVMPGVDGHELILTIRRLCPYMDTMVMSGALFPSDTRERTYCVLPKPFTKDQLFTTVKRILDAQL